MKIFVAIDGSDHGDLILCRAAEIAALDEAQFVMLHAACGRAARIEY